MTRKNARSAVKAETLKIHDNVVTWTNARALENNKLLPFIKAIFIKIYNPLSLLFIFCTLLMLASVFRMWNHWFEISASLGYYQAAGVLATVTGAALILAWWLNTDNH